MSNLNDFYTSILNINHEDKTEVIKNIVLNEKNKLISILGNQELDGFCKYLANQIEIELKKNNITCYTLDLNEFVSVDHVIILAEFMTVGGEVCRLLIDPTFSQFVRQENKTLVTLDAWPSEKIKEKQIVYDLVSAGVTKVNNELFHDYLNAFTQEEISVDLDSFLINCKILK